MKDHVLLWAPRLLGALSRMDWVAVISGPLALAGALHLLSWLRLRGHARP